MKKSELIENGYKIFDKGSSYNEEVVDFLIRATKEKYPDCKCYRRKSNGKIYYEIYNRLPDDKTIRTVGELRSILSDFDDDARLMVVPSITTIVPEKKENCEDCIIMANVYAYLNTNLLIPRG